MSSQTVEPASIWQGNTDTQVSLVNADNSFLVQRFVATQGQTLFTLTGFAYTVGTNSLQVFLNGVYQNIITDYSETTGMSFTLNAGVNANDIVVAIGIVGVTGAPQAAISAAQAAASQIAAALSATTASAAATSASTSATNAAASAAQAAAAAMSVVYNAIPLVAHGTV